MTHYVESIHSNTTLLIICKNVFTVIITHLNSIIVFKHSPLSWTDIGLGAQIKTNLKLINSSNTLKCFECSEIIH